MEHKKVCSKEKFTLKNVKGFLNYLKKSGYKNKPWRDEVSYYKCEICGSYHTSKRLESASDTVIKNKSYFDFQKEKWGAWLQNKSNKKGNIK